MSATRMAASLRVTIMALLRVSPTNIRAPPAQSIFARRLAASWFDAGCLTGSGGAAMLSFHVIHRGFQRARGPPRHSDLAARRCSSPAARPASARRLRADFAGQGAKVAVGCHSSEAEAQALVRGIERAGGEALVVKGDVASPAECDCIVSETTARVGRLDGLINNAGLMLGRFPSFEVGDAHVQAVIDLNARSVVSMTRAAVPWLSARAASSSIRPRSPPETAARAARFFTPPPRASSRR